MRRYFPVSPRRQRAPGFADGHLLCALLAYYVAFGPHGPRRPVNPPGTTLKVTLGVTAGIAAAGALFATAKALGKLSLYVVPHCHGVCSRCRSPAPA